MLFINRRIALLLAAALLFTLPARATEKAPIRVVTTTSDLASIARYIGGDRVEVMSLATGQEDPHHIAAKPSYMMAARKADLWIRTGMELEIGYEGLILDGSRNSDIHVGAPGHLCAATGVLRRDVPTTKVDRSMGDIHPQGNPHYLLDPLNGRIVAKTIAARLARISPEDAGYFSERVKAFRRELDERMFGKELVAKYDGGKLWALVLKGRFDELLARANVPELGGWLGRMKPHAGKKILPFHRNWTYFLNRFELTAPMEVESKPGIPPSPGRLTDVIEYTKREKLQVLIMAPYFSRSAPELISEKTGIDIVPCAMFPGALPGVDEYFDVFDRLTEQISRQLAE